VATSGTKTFSLDTGDVIEEAYELAGLELRTGYDAATARRSLNIMFADWANRGINLWTVEQVILSLTSGTASYTLNSYDLDVLEAIIRVYDSTTSTTYTDISITRINRLSYLNIPDKTTTARPSQFFIDRQETPVLYLYPTPDSVTTYKFVSYRMQRIDDVTASAQDQEVPSRFIPSMTAGLAYQIALKKNPAKAEMLKFEYEELFNRAASEDTDRAIVQLVPRITM
jgi:hypothetical protein|tara:strand:- start:2892 stop:3572 length:681 start_codon:yes stop_codon:yes gene_type:complete